MKTLVFIVLVFQKCFSSPAVNVKVHSLDSSLMLVSNDYSLNTSSLNLQTVHTPGMDSCTYSNLNMNVNGYPTTNQACHWLTSKEHHIVHIMFTLS